MQHSMVWSGTGIMTGEELNRLGSYVGAMAQSPQGEKEPVAADLKTAEAFGKRVGEATVRWVRGRQD